jgi:quercetin dioxygenase-like cupin family protein
MTVTRFRVVINRTAWPFRTGSASFRRHPKGQPDLSVPRLEDFMTHRTRFTASFGMALLILAIPPELKAQPAVDSPQRVEIKRVDLDRAPGIEVVVSTAEYKPGETLPTHFHHGLEVAYILQGATVQVPGQPPRALPTGASVLNQRGIRHAGFTVVGETSLKLFTVHIFNKGVPLFDHSAR